MQVKRLYHTVRYLKLRQVIYRLLYQVKPLRKPASIQILKKPVKSQWVAPVEFSASQFNQKKFVALNHAVEFENGINWQKSGEAKLWLYHLHYFDFLKTFPSQSSELITSWFEANTQVNRVGWEPYPISLRVVNWIKWDLMTNQLNNTAQSSLHQQVQVLLQRLEYHLLGNHLWANAKTLLFAGCYFSGKFSERCLRKGLRLFNQELDRQILQDGGHFERSPMYQAILTEDLLDLINLFQTYDLSIPSLWTLAAHKMLNYLATMIHPDGDISFFNDATLRAAPQYHQLVAYAQRLGLHENSQAIVNSVNLIHSGYYRLANNRLIVIIDAAPLGPDFLPAHGHADTLSFECSLGEHRLFVNSGVSTYENCQQRNWERSTAAHNTVTIDQQDSSQVWSAFRVAQRAKPTCLESSVDIEHTIVAMHDGYQRLEDPVTHTRTWQLKQDGLFVKDRLDGKKSHQVHVYYHLHPRFHFKQIAPTVFSILAAGRQVAHFAVPNSVECLIKKTSYAPEFGKKQMKDTLMISCNEQLPIELNCQLTCLTHDQNSEESNVGMSSENIIFE